MRRESGRIVLVWTEEVTTTLTEDEAADATVLHVEDASVFNDDDEGGSLRIGTQLVAYTAVDDDASTVTLAEPLAEAAEADDDVAAWSLLYDEVDTRQWALVDPDGRGDKADMIQAIVSDALELVDGDRGTAGEACVLEREPGSAEWILMGVQGRPAAARGRKWEADDSYTMTETDVTNGFFVFQLSHEPVAESVQAVWAGVTQPPTEFAYTDGGLVTWPLDGFAEAGDVFWFHYQYRRGPVGVVVVDPPPPPPEEVPLELEFVGSDFFDGPGDIELPVGAAIGNLFVVMGHGPGVGGKNQSFAESGGHLNTDTRLIGTSTSNTCSYGWGILTTLDDYVASVPEGGTLVLAVYADVNGNEVTIEEFHQTSRESDTTPAGDDMLDTFHGPSMDCRGSVILIYQDRGSGSSAPSFVLQGYNGAGVAAAEMRVESWIADDPLDTLEWSPALEWPNSSLNIYDRTLISIGLGAVEA